MAMIRLLVWPVVSLLILLLWRDTWLHVHSVILFLVLGRDMIKMTKFSCRHIPLIPEVPLFGALPYVNLKYFPENMLSWSKKLGQIFQLKTADDTYIFISSYQGIREVLLKESKATAGRPLPFCTKTVLNGTGILFSHSPDKTWKSLRMTSQKHMKQFGEGMTHLEYVITDVAEDMFTAFRESTGRPFNPKITIFDAALNSIAFLMTGVRTHSGDPIVEKMRTYERTVLRFAGGSQEVKFMIYDVRPSWTKIGFKSWKVVQSMCKLQDSIWEDIQELQKKNPDSTGLHSVLMDHIDEMTRNGRSDNEYTEDDVKKTMVSLLLAGVTTTSATFYALINILAHRPYIQNKLYDEIKHIGKTKYRITLDDRINMPYCRATVLEVLRYVSVVAMGVPHRSIQDTNICGVHIPDDTVIITNLWALHHDQDFWQDPYSFRPERFLDDDGQLVTADHPNRKHLLPFGAGPRVCLGESLALARLFMWLSTCVQHFKVDPAEGNKAAFTDPRRHAFKGTVRVCPYDVIFTEREASTW